MSQSTHGGTCPTGETGQKVSDVPQVVIIPRAEETTQVATRTLETGSVVVHVVPRERHEVIDVPLTQEHAHVEHVPVNRFAQRVEPPRQEGDVTIVPIYEEVVVIERRLMLKEELRITRHQSVRHEQRDVTLREEHVEILRSEAPGARSSGQPLD